MLSRTLLLCVILALISLSVASKCKGRKVVTFNTGLTPRIPNYEKRLELIPKALLKTKADVLCLQEVWFGRDIEAILKVLRKRYSYAYSPLDNGPKRLRKRKRGKTATDAACQNDNTTSLLNCVGLCLQVPAETQEACFLSNCLATIFTLSQNCRSCVTFALRDQQIFEDLCFKSTNNPINQEGLLIVSKRKIMKAETTRYLDRNIKQLIPRSYIEAENITECGMVVNIAKRGIVVNITECGMVVIIAECGMVENIAECGVVVNIERSIAKSSMVENIAECDMVENIAECGMAVNIAECGMVENIAVCVMVENIAKRGMVENIAKCGVVENIAECSMVENIAKCGMVENIAECGMVENIAECGMVENIAKCGMVENIAKCVFIKAATGIDSWEKQQLNEILTLRTRLAKVSDFVVAGDMNNGPAGNAFAAELPQNYAILAAGYVNNYLSSGDPQCTFCVSNNLNVSPLDIVIDHVLLKGRRAKSSKRILGTFGPQKVQLSDHHGVETIVCA